MESIPFRTTIRQAHLAVQGDDHPITLGVGFPSYRSPEIDGGHDPVPEFLGDEGFVGILRGDEGGWVSLPQ